MAFEAVEDWCGNLDMANNFHKIDGFHVLKKVWPLIQFAYFCFLKRIIDLPSWQINDPSLGKAFFSFVPPSKLRCLGLRPMMDF